MRQQIKDHEKKIILRNQILNESLSSWNLNIVDSNVSELGMNLKKNKNITYIYYIYLYLNSYKYKFHIIFKTFRSNSFY